MRIVFCPESVLKDKISVLNSVESLGSVLLPQWGLRNLLRRNQFQLLGKGQVVLSSVEVGNLCSRGISLASLLEISSFLLQVRLRKLFSGEISFTSLLKVGPFLP